MGNMLSYLLNFGVYILAMAGLSFIAFFVWRSVTSNNFRAQAGSMKIEDSLSLSPRKTLHIIRVNNERFLIASDIDKTTFLSKLEEGQMPDFGEVKNDIIPDFKKCIENIKTARITKKEKPLATETEKPLKEPQNKTVNILKELTKKRKVGE